MSQTYARTPDVIEAGVGGEVVLLHTGSWQYFELDRVGSAIWRQLEQPATLEQLVTGLTADFDVPRDQCERDTGTFLSEIAANGLVVVNGP